VSRSPLAASPRLIDRKPDQGEEYDYAGRRREVLGENEIEQLDEAEHGCHEGEAGDRDQVGVWFIPRPSLNPEAKRSAAASFAAEHMTPNIRAPLGRHKGWGQGLSLHAARLRRSPGCSHPQHIAR
jgi:hypothetical protein